VRQDFLKNICRNGSISVKRLDDDFGKHLEFKKQVQKVVLSPKTYLLP